MKTYLQLLIACIRYLTVFLMANCVSCGTTTTVDILIFTDILQNSVVPTSGDSYS